MVEIGGNTYAVREQLKAMGGKWHAARRVWLVPDDRAEEARKLVAGAVKLRGNADDEKRPTHYPRTCATCRKRINYGVYCGKCEYS